MYTVSVVLSGLASPDDPEACALMVPFLRQRMAETGGFYGYGHMILRYHGSFVGVLEKCLHNSQGRTIYTHNIWELFTAAAKTLSPQELIDGLREVAVAGKVHSNEEKLKQIAIPAAIKMLEAGMPFPEWSDVWKML